MEIPSSIKYEFFLMLGGGTPFIFVFWMYLFHESRLKELLIINPLFFVGLLIAISGGLFLFLIGFRELTEDFTRKKDISIREYRLKRFNLDEKLKILPKAYIRDIIFPKEDIEKD